MQKGIIKNVNRLTGEPVDAQDLASIFTGIVGNESGVLTVFDELRLEKISDNKVRLHSGVYSIKGHMLYIPKGSYEDFEIGSGTLGANRIDLLVAEYVKNGEGDGEDTLHFRIIKGETTSGTPQAPQLTQQDINANGIMRQESIYEIRRNGLEVKNSFAANLIKDNNSLKKELNELTGKIDSMVYEFTAVAPSQVGWESAKYVDVPSSFRGKFAVVSAWIINDNNVLMPLDLLSVRPSRDRQKVHIELRSSETYARNKQITISILKTK